MGVSGNTSKISSIMAAFCIVVYIAAIAFGAVRIVVSIGERRSLAEKEFFELSDRASSSAVFLGFMSEAYQESLKDFIGASYALLGVIITGSNGEYAFERYPGSGIVWAGGAPRFRMEAGIPGEPFFMPLRIEGQRNVTIQANYSFIDYALFQKTLRNTLLAVLAALITAFITLLVEVKAKNKAALYRSDTSGGSHASRESKPGKIEPKIPAREDPQGLYTPEGNIGWESYTHDRLSSELHRCSSFEQDLTYMAMEFPETFASYRQFADETVNFFSMRDLIFEKGEKGISVIVPNTDLEQGMIKAEEFRSRIIAKLPESFEGRSELCVGLSSRSGRLVDADRLILEAFSALAKALEDRVSHVVAFKSDPEKYRSFIRQNGRNA
jgi:hypothetical protein